MIYEQHNIKIHSIIFILCVLFTLFSPPYNQSSAQQNVIKEATGGMASWMVETVQDNWKKDKAPTNVWSGWQNSCWVDCKQKQLEKAWTNPNIAPVLIAECKKQDIEVVNCIKIWASILWAESSGWNRCSKFNCFWVLWKSFKSYEESVQDWVKRFWKYWYRQKNPSAFYSDSQWRIPKTKYCMSESSSWSKWYCPNWHKHAWNVFNMLDF